MRAGDFEGDFKCLTSIAEGKFGQGLKAYAINRDPVQGEFVNWAYSSLYFLLPFKSTCPS